MAIHGRSGWLAPHSSAMDVQGRRSVSHTERERERRVKFLSNESLNASPVARLRVRRQTAKGVQAFHKLSSPAVS